MNISSLGFDKLLDIVIGLVLAMYVIIEVLVPKISTWTASLSSVGGTDWSWVVGLVFLLVMVFVVKAIASNKK